MPTDLEAAFARKRKLQREREKERQDNTTTVSVLIIVCLVMVVLLFVDKSYAQALQCFEFQLWYKLRASRRFLE
jgi:hypothetical protein